MDRDPKQREEFQKLSIDLILEDTVFDDLPKCVCPIDSFPDTMPTTFCVTKCYSPCENFREFSFILDYCSDGDCGLDSVCESCLEKIEQFKEVMQKLKAVFADRNTDKSVNYRVNQYINWCNNLSQNLQEARGIDK